eukprot:354917-Chlamydomonas_euryale.AAC.3
MPAPHLSPLAHCAPNPPAVDIGGPKPQGALKAAGQPRRLAADAVQHRTGQRAAYKLRRATQRGQRPKRRQR